MDWLSVGVGALSSIFGGGGNKSNTLERQYANYEGLLKRALALYDGTDFAAQDAQTVSAYDAGVQRRAMALLGNYDAKAAGAGSGRLQSDTRKDRSRAQIAADAATQTSDLEAQLSSTRTNRQKALLPDASSAVQGFQGAQALDQYSMANEAGNIQGILALAKLLAKKKSAGNAYVAPGQNDLFNLRIDPYAQTG